jgi:hypothetical protein
MNSAVATIVAGALGLIGILMSAWANIRIKQLGDRAAKELEEFRITLAEDKEIRAESRSKQATAEATVSRYREPLVSAAFDLQARIYNIHRGGFFGGDRTDYHLDHTLFVFGQYLGWREIIRQEIQFLDLGDAPTTKNLAEHLERITRSLSQTADELPDNFNLFRGEQRAIGEKMMCPAGGVEERVVAHGCLGYAAFVEALRDPDFDVWFTRLRDYILDVESSTTFDFGRLSFLQNALIDLIDALDSNFIRFPEHLRKRIEMSPAVSAIYAR